MTAHDRKEARVWVAASDEAQLPRPKYWEGREPPPDYYEPVDPYCDPPVCPYDLFALSRYARETERAVTELSYDEIEQIYIGESRD